MKKRLGIIAAVAGLGVVMAGGAASAEAPECNWGEVTSGAIAEGFDQGAHASAFAGSPRTGLANVLEQGNLDATCLFVS